MGRLHYGPLNQIFGEAPPDSVAWFKHCQGPRLPASMHGWSRRHYRWSTSLMMFVVGEPGWRQSAAVGAGNLHSSWDGEVVDGRRRRHRRLDDDRPAAQLTQVARRDEVALRRRAKPVERRTRSAEGDRYRGVSRLLLLFQIESDQLASCLIYARPLPAHPRRAFFYWTRCFENHVPFHNSTPIYLMNLLWKLGLGFGLDSELHYFNIFHGEYNTI